MGSPIQNSVIPRGSPASREHQQSIRLVINAWMRVRIDWWIKEEEVIKPADETE